MRRGEVWTVAGGGDYAGKPRPAVIVQDDAFEATRSVTVCALTTDPTEAPLFRIPIAPNERNGLRAPCSLMVDKLTTIPRSRVGSHLGVLGPKEIMQMNRAIVVFVGLARSREVRAG